MAESRTSGCAVWSSVSWLFLSPARGDGGSGVVAVVVVVVLWRGCASCRVIYCDANLYGPLFYIAPTYERHWSPMGRILKGNTMCHLCARGIAATDATEHTVTWRPGSSCSHALSRCSSRACHARMFCFSFFFDFARGCPDAGARVAADDHRKKKEPGAAGAKDPDNIWFLLPVFPPNRHMTPRARQSTTAPTEIKKVFCGKKKKKEKMGSDRRSRKERPVAPCEKRGEHPATIKKRPRLLSFGARHRARIEMAYVCFLCSFLFRPAKQCASSARAHIEREKKREGKKKK